MHLVFHIIDALWTATAAGMNNYRQRIAEELLAAESQLRDYFFGHAVSRNGRWTLTRLVVLIG